MDPDNRKYVRIERKTLAIIIVILIAGLLGWWLGHNSGSDGTYQSQKAQKPPMTTELDSPAAGSDVKALVSYSLPAGWKEFTCPNATGYNYAGPPTAGCDSTNIVRLYVDAANNTDCNQLQGVENVSKHICISEFINGKKSLKSETVYNEKSSYSPNTTIKAFYINTSDGVVKVEYTFNGENSLQSGFEQLARSVKSK